MESEWAQASGRARLLSWVVVHPPVLPGVEGARAVRRRARRSARKGARTMGNLLGATADELRMDMPMVVDFAPSPDGDLVPQWRLR